MPISLLGEKGAQLKTLQELRAAEASDVKRTGGEVSPYLKIDLPQAKSPKVTQIRDRIRERIIALFMAGMKDAVDVRGYMPVPGESLRACDEDDLKNVMPDIRAFLRRDDKEFNLAVADRECGAITILLEAIDFAAANMDPIAALKWLQIVMHEKYTLAATPERKQQTGLLKNLPWYPADGAEGKSLSRKGIVRGRLMAMELMDFRSRNKKLQEDALSKFPKKRKLIQQLIDSFNASAAALRLKDYHRERWFYVLLDVVVALSRITTPISDALEILARELRLASRHGHMSDAIDRFKFQTLPKIIKAEAAKKAAAAAAKAQQSVAGAPAPAEAPAAAVAETAPGVDEKAADSKKPQ